MTARVVREAADTDREAWVGLRASMFRAMGVPGVDDVLWRRAAERWFDERGADVRIVVVEAAGEVVATAMGERRRRAPSPASPSGVEVLISNVSTFEHVRGLGHGAAAFAGVMRWVREESGADRAELFATGAGQAMYERAGFAVNEWPAMRLVLT